MYRLTKFYGQEMSESELYSFIQATKEKRFTNVIGNRTEQSYSLWN
jgi:hypothetical protein